MYQTFLISVSHFQARVNRKMCLITGCGVSVSMAFTPEQRHDARYLLARLWPAIMSPNCWIPGSGLGRGVFLDASKYAVCESWLRCHAPKDFHWRDILIHVNATYRWHAHERYISHRHRSFLPDIKKQGVHVVYVLDRCINICFKLINYTDDNEQYIAA